MRWGTCCSLSGSCPRIAQRIWAFRRRGPAEPAVRPALLLGAHAVSPARLQRVETPSRPRRLGCAAFRSARVPLGATRLLARDQAYDEGNAAQVRVQIGEPPFLVMSEILAIITIIVVSVLNCLIWHAVDSNYLRASALAATTFSAIVQLESYIEVGYWEPFIIISIVSSFIYSFVMALLVGIPYQIYRARRDRERNLKVHF